MLNRLIHQFRRRRSTVTSLGALMGSQTLTMVLGMVGGLVQARYIGPGIFGYFGTFGILAGYLSFLHLGSLTALQREYPYWAGKGDLERARHTAAVTQGWILVVCSGVFLLYLVLTLVSLFSGYYPAAACWAVQLLTSSVSFYLLYLGCTYRSTQEFTNWAKIGAFGSVLNFVLLPLVRFFGLWGLCIRSAIPALVSTVLLHRNRPVHIRPLWRPREFWELVKFGLPMDLAGYLATSGMMAVSNTLIRGYWDAKTLGLVMFARTAESAVHQMSCTVSNVFIPRLNAQMGKTEDLRQCARYAMKPVLAGLLMMGAAVTVASFLCRPMVQWLTPGYIDSVPYILVLMWAGLYPIMTIPNYVLAAGKHNYSTAVSFLTAFVVFVVLAGIVVLLKLSAVFIVVAYVIGKLSGTVAAGILLWWRIGHGARLLSGPAAEAPLAKELMEGES